MRQIVLDTETTGLDPANGHRVVEIGCVELLNAIPTGQTFHTYIDPQRDMPDEAFRVHGLSAEFLAGKPCFSDISEAFLNFLGDSQLLAHNAEFDMRFINAELRLLGLEPIPPHRVIDTLALARRRHPGASNSLDALCLRFGIDNSRRTKHGALLDAEILSEVYAELLGGRQSALVFKASSQENAQKAERLMKQRPVPLLPILTEAEKQAHREFIEKLHPNPIWTLYWKPSEPENAGEGMVERSAASRAV